MDYFEFFGIPVDFRVDLDALKEIYYRNSKLYHPDYHTLADAQQQEEMLERSSLNNAAFRTLSDPDLRMQYVLRLKGLLGEEDKQPQLPQDFLMDMMDINESLMELEFDFDAEKYRQTLAEADRIEAALQAGIQPVLENYDDSSATPEDLDAIKDYYLKKRYLLRIRENLSKFAGPAGMAEW